MIADTSVNSTKLNLILKTRARLDMQLQTDGTARSLVSYEVHNPFPQWKQERDPRLVKALMLDGVYGSYVRVYAGDKAQLRDARLDNKPAGVEQNGLELGKRVFGRFFPVLPGATSSAQVLYETKDVVQPIGVDTYRYQLSVQKQAGTNALPLDVRVLLPKGAELQSARLDGKPQTQGTTILTDLRTDRVIEIVFTMPGGERRS
jgi:hypothetical protein